MAVPCHIPTNSVGGLPFLHTLSSIYCCKFFDAGHSGRCEMAPHGGFDLHFSLMSDVEHPFILAVSGSSSGKCPFRYFPYEIQGTFAPLSWYSQLSSLPLLTNQFWSQPRLWSEHRSSPWDRCRKPWDRLALICPSASPCFLLSVWASFVPAICCAWETGTSSSAPHSSLSIPVSPGFPVHLSPRHLWLNHNLVVL